MTHKPMRACTSQGPVPILMYHEVTPRPETSFRLGREVRDLAYLFGAFDERVRAIKAETGYRSACSTRPGLSPVDDDRLALRRVPVYGADSFVDFACRLRTAHTARDLLRRSLHRFRPCRGGGPTPP